MERESLHDIIRLGNVGTFSAWYIESVKELPGQKIEISMVSNLYFFRTLKFLYFKGFTISTLFVF